MPPKKAISALDKAMRLLAVRAYSTNELTQRLFRSGFPPDEVEAAVRECEKRHYLNDRLFAEDCAEMWLERGHGARSIRHKLYQRGVPAELAAAAIAGTEEQEPEAACTAIRSKLPSLLREPDPRKRRAKALRFLAGRGFTGNAAAAAMKLLAQAAADAEDGEDIP
ncbi:MAG: regulatory protein RecX [Lentisphaeria bacterium]|nr:regulatory protein RecX [Lentisphaeria bacterium]